MIWPITYLARVMLEQPVSWDCVKHAAAPQGPFGAVPRAQVSRLSRSLFGTSCRRMARSSSYGWLTRFMSATFAGVTFGGPPWYVA